MEKLSKEKGGVGSAEDDERLDHSDVLSEPGDEANKEAVEATDEGSAKDDCEEREDGHENLATANFVHVHQGDHGVVKDHRYSIIEERLAKHEEVEAKVDVNLLKDRQNSHWVHSRDEARKDKSF